MKTVIQLDDYGYFVGTTIADESPLEPGIYLIPSKALDVEPPVIPEGHLARWDKTWVYEPISAPMAAPVPEPIIPTYAGLRAAAYPSIPEQLDMQYWDSINGTTVWADTIAAIKAEFPKP